MRIALVGAGDMGRQHAAAFAALPDVEIAAVIGRGSERAGRLAHAHGARARTELGPVLDDPDIDAVDVTYPTALHPEIVRRALEAGKHVFCETPLCATALEAEALRTVARRTGKHLQIALLMRFARPAVDLHDVLTTGALGTPHAVTTARLAPGATGGHHGDVLEEILLFDLDVLCWSLGPPRSTGARAILGQDDRAKHVVAALEWDDCHAWCEASTLAPPGRGYSTSVRALCEEGALDGIFRAPRAGPPQVEVRRIRGVSQPEISRDLGQDPVAAECRHFSDVVHGRADAALLDVDQALLSLRVLDAARASLDGSS